LVFNIYVEEYVVHKVMRQFDLYQASPVPVRTLFECTCISKVSKSVNISMRYKVDFLIKLFILR
jgi:hypothetical protein